MTESQVAAVTLCAMEILRLCREKRIVHGNVTPSAFRLRTRKADPFRIPDLCFAPSGWLKATDFRHSRYIFRKSIPLQQLHFYLTPCASI